LGRSRSAPRLSNDAFTDEKEIRMMNDSGERRMPEYLEFERLNLAQVLEAQAKRRPDKVWLVHGQDRVTFRSFNDAVERLAAALRNEGLRKGDRCGLLFPNGIEYLLFQFALIKLGAVLVPLNTRYRSSELSFMLGYSEARFLFMVDGFLKADFREILNEIRPNLPKLERIHVRGEEIPGWASPIGPLLGYPAPEAEIRVVRSISVDPTEPATILFTSGTASQPKAVVLSQEARVFSGIRIVERMRITEEDVLLNPLPFCHEFGGFTIMSHALLCGCKMVILDIFDAEDALHWIEQERVSVLYGVPTMFSYMLQSFHLKKRDVSSLRTGYMSGAPCPLELVRKVQGDMGCNISVAYGSSEAPSHTISEYEDSPETKAKTVGKPIRDGIVRIVDGERRDVPLGTAGEIAVKGKNVLIEYYRRPDLTARSIDPERFFYTGDLGRMDEKGYLIFVGRKTDMIISGGFNVYPLEVEEVLYRLPFVHLAAVVGLPDPDLGEMVCACIVLREGMQGTPEEVIQYCKRQLANYKVPKRVEFMDTLPATTATNKIKKTELKEILKEAKECTTH
jgi:fatty-acyl-CoA synthase